MDLTYELSIPVTETPSYQNGYQGALIRYDPLYSLTMTNIELSRLEDALKFYIKAHQTDDYPPHQRQSDFCSDLIELIKTKRHYWR